jgi:hypothetical protein
MAAAPLPPQESKIIPMRKTGSLWTTNPRLVVMLVALVVYPLIVGFLPSGLRLYFDMLFR